MGLDAATGERPGFDGRRPARPPRKRALLFTWTVCSSLGAELGYLVFDGSPLPFALGLVTLLGAQGYIVRARSGLDGPAWGERRVARTGRRPAMFEPQGVCGGGPEGGSRAPSVRTLQG